MILMVLLMLAVDGPTLLEGGMRVGMPAEILADEEIREQLGSGLTTGFSIRWRTGLGREGVTRIEIRYELWDEVFLVRVITRDGVTEAVFESFEALRAWWRGPVLSLRGEVVRGLELVLEIYPFSSVEQHNARQWLSPDAPRPENDDVTVDSRRVMTALLASSIRREPMRRFRWKIEP